VGDMTDHFILDIAWDWDSTEIAVSLPPLVGPFDSKEEARKWGEMNIPNGSWEIRPLGRPYARATGERV
jgi:hypothetical protein